MRAALITGGLIFAAILGIGYATQASAAGKFSGCHVGAAAGYSITNAKTTLDAAPNNLLTIDGLGAEGMTGTLSVGCDMQFDRFLIGVWGDYSFHDADIKLSALNGALTAGTGLDHSWAIGGRAGILLTYETLVYGLVGYTEATFNDMSAAVNGTTVGSVNVPDLSGWIVGGGVETKLPIPGMSLDLRYTAAMYDREDVGIAKGVSIGFEPTVHTARVGVKYLFSFDGMPKSADGLKLSP